MERARSRLRDPGGSGPGELDGSEIRRYRDRPLGLVGTGKANLKAAYDLDGVGSIPAMPVPRRRLPALLIISINMTQ
jgi:hypothetical protein